MKYNDTYSMIGAMLNQGFEVEFKKERDKKEKRRRFFRKLNAGREADCECPLYSHDISIKEKFRKYFREYV